MHPDTAAYLLRVEKAPWAQVPLLIQEGIDAGFPQGELAVGLRSERKQTIEILTGVLGAAGNEDVAEALIEMMIAQADGANAIRARNALISIGKGCAAAVLMYLNEKNWQIRVYLLHCLAVYRQSYLVSVLRKVAEEDKSRKVRETAAQAIEYILGDKPISEYPLLPAPDAREVQIGVVSSGY